MPLISRERQLSYTERQRQLPEKRPVTTFDELMTLVAQAAVTRAKMPTLGLGADDFQELDRQLQALNPDFVKQRLDRFKLNLPRFMDPFKRFMGGQLWQTKALRGLNRPQLGLATEIFLRDLPLVLKTHEKLHPEPAPSHEVLSQRLLVDALFFIELSEDGSVAHQLEDPIELARKGVTINLRTKNDVEDIISGYKLPSQFLEILRTLKYGESETVLKEWILVQMSKTEEDATQTLRFLRTFVNFISFLDTMTHMQLWKTPEGVPAKEEEFLLRAFDSIANSIGYAKHHLARGRADSKILDEMDELTTLVKLRFGEVFSGTYQTTLYTASKAALTPSSEDFAKFAALHLKRVSQDRDKQKVASGLVNLAESIGIENIEPLLRVLDVQPELKTFFLNEALASGLIKDPKAVLKLRQKLKSEPWTDAALVKWAEVIQQETRTVVVDVLTGTFGPKTIGHTNLVKIRSEILGSLPKHDSEGRGIQRIILVVPMMDSVSNPEYQKIPSRVGNLKERVGSIIGALAAGGVDRQRVFVTTLLQPDPNIPQSLEDRVEHTINVLRARIVESIGKTRGLANVQVLFNYTFGPDSIKWEKPAELTVLPGENQPERVRQLGCSTVVRRNYLYNVLANLRELRQHTGLEHVTLTPGTPYSSSTEAIKDLHFKGFSNFVAPGMQFYFAKHWGHEAINKRRSEPKRSHYERVDEVYESLVREVDEEVRRLGLAA